MSAATTARPTLSDEEVVRLLETLKDSDSVELKLTVPETHQRSTVAALALAGVRARAAMRSSSSAR